MEKQFLISTGITKSAAGSAYVELGNMKITCSIHGPRDKFLSDTFASQGELFVDFRFAPFCSKDKHRPLVVDKETRALSALLKKVLLTSVDINSFPKSVVEVYIMVLELDGDPLCLATMCASLALANAGINLFGMLGCCCVSVMKDNSFILNPTSDEIKESKCYTTLAILNSTKDITYISHNGATTPATCAMSISKGVEEASRFCAAMRQYLLSTIN